MSTGSATKKAKMLFESFSKAIFADIIILSVLHNSKFLKSVIKRRYGRTVIKKLCFRL